MPRWTIDSGGGQSTGGSFTINGTIGQPDTGVMSGGGYTLSGKFWAGSSGTYHGGQIYIPLVIR